MVLLASHVNKSYIGPVPFIYLMIKKLLGIKKIEKKMDAFTDSLVRSWEWIKHLNNITEQYEERLKRLEESNMKLIELANQLINRFEGEIYEEEEAEEVIEQGARVPNQKLDLPDKDMLLIQILYQYAAFDKENSISTQEIFDNLTYKITDRGLRKKLMNLSKSGLINSIKKGNTRYWFINAGNLAKIKKAIKEKAE